MTKLEDLARNNRFTQLLLNSLLKAENFTIEEELESLTLLRYPKSEQFLGLRSETLEEQIQVLSELGVLGKKEIRRIPCCPKCQGISMRPSRRCPSCNSDQISRRELLEHLKCGHIGTEEEFTGKEGLLCPKCGRKMIQIGVDHRRVGPMYVCSCGQRFSAPLETWTCNGCGNEFSPDQLAARPLHAYYLLEKMKTEIRGLLFDLKPLVEYFSEMRFQVTSPGLVVGFSGAEHRYDMLGIDPSRKESVVLRLCLDEKEVDVLQIAGLYAEAMDSVITRRGLRRPDHIIVLCVPRAEPSARRQAEIFGITCIDAYDSAEAVQKIRESPWHERVVKYQSLLF
jgi:predicted RNA-binding Zn-ribbon protein involved in translation (DUF1610 family)